MKINLIDAIARTLQEGAIKYGQGVDSFDNWANIPATSHINHALNHLYRQLEHDQSENHLDHAVTRIYMALYITSVDHENITRTETTGKSTP